ncbi:SURF1 family protein [Palleronia sp. LCG004]|uniref:SURF1 family protein n=1 Tax=Palleronia sp. LCG004 TaxID=3079304 RepID=UPI0029427491|nr:SURF1 family protein [Palleronia sp. LCG004]WOI55677.1 SURF1 family protein [Palleronia sp. LCG004]
MRKIAFAIFALLGLALLLWLGIWQVQRLAWKTGILDRIEARISAAPIALPASPTEEADEYLPVAVTGRLGGDEIHVLISTPQFGASYRVISALETAEGRRVLVDLGAIPVGEKDETRPSGEVAIVGNLLWPDETDGFTPEPDLSRNIWFARDLPAMAGALGTEEILVVARETSLPGPQPLPIDGAEIPNDHLQYAITWFSMAAIWAGMTLLLLWRMARRSS